MRRLPLPRALVPWVRRVAIGVIALLVLAAASFTTFVLTRDVGALGDAFVQRLESETGGVFRYKARRLVAWPKPKIVFEEASFERPDRAMRVLAPQIVLRVDVADLLDGAISGPTLTLDRAEIQLGLGRLEGLATSPRAITGSIARIAGAFDGVHGLDRLRVTLAGSRILFRGGDSRGQDLALEPVDLVFGVSGRRGRMDLSARVGGARPFDLEITLPTVASLSGGRTQQASLRYTRGAARLAFAGRMRLDADIGLAGRAELAFDSRLDRAIFARSGLAPARSGLAARADLSLDPRGIGLDALRISRDDRQLAGIAALREVNGRWSVSATLAGDLIDGATAGETLARFGTAEGRWSPAPLSINPLPWLDLDIRLSTPSLRLGPLQLQNAAVSVLTRAGRSEVAIVDSRFGEGVLKARLGVVDNDAGQDVRLQVSGDRIETRALLGQVLGLSRLGGAGSFVIQAEGHGRSVEAVVASLAGTAQLDIRDGEIAGVDLARLLQRADQRPEIALAGALSGRTAFEVLRATLAIRGGKMEPVGSTFQSSQVTAGLDGMIDLADLRSQLAIVLKRRQDVAGKPGEFFAFRLEGPLLSPSLKPDPSLLPDRG